MLETSSPVAALMKRRYRTDLKIGDPKKYLPPLRCAETIQIGSAFFYVRRSRR